MWEQKSAHPAANPQSITFVLTVLTLPFGRRGLSVKEIRQDWMSLHLALLIDIPVYTCMSMRFSTNTASQSADPISSHCPTRYQPAILPASTNPPIKICHVLILRQRAVSLQQEYNFPTANCCVCVCVFFSSLFDHPSAKWTPCEDIFWGH